MTLITIFTASLLALSARAIPCEILANKLVLVPVMVNDTGPHLFLLDTGGASTMLSSSLAAHLRLEATARQRVDAVGGSTAAPAPIGRLAELRLGGERFRDLDVLWMDLASLRRVDSRIEGVIGQDVLLTRSFLLDYDARRLLFVAGGDADDARSDASGVGIDMSGDRLPVDWAEGRPFVRGLVHRADRQPSSTTEQRRFVIDSAATHIVLFETNGRHAPTKGMPAMTMTMTSHAGSQPIAATTIDQLTLSSSTVLRNLVAGLVPNDPAQGRVEDGLLPASLFRAIYFDHRAGFVIVNPTRRP